MSIKLRLLVILSLLSIASCSVFMGPPAERVKGFDNWRLCNELADFTFRRHSEWLWHITHEIRSRGLDTDQSCAAVYTSQMAYRMKKHAIGAKPLTFEQALGDNAEK